MLDVQMLEWVYHVILSFDIGLVSWPVVCRGSEPVRARVTGQCDTMSDFLRRAD